MVNSGQQLKVEAQLELDRLLHRIENGIELSESVRNLWRLCERENIDFDCLQAYMKNSLLQYKRTMDCLSAFLQADSGQLNPHKVAFILCVNDEEQFSEAAAYIEYLDIPAGMEMEIIPVRGALSMCAGYEQGRKASDAKYKIYLHQDVLVIRHNLIDELRSLFQDSQVGMAGLAGCKKLPSSAIWWDGWGAYNKVAHIRAPGTMELFSGYVPCCEVEAADGVMLATQYDIPWRADIFRSWHFYDISICQEYRRRGYKILLPLQEEPWVIHRTSHTSVGPDYYKERDIFLREYHDMLQS